MIILLLRKPVYPTEVVLDRILKDIKDILKQRIMNDTYKNNITKSREGKGSKEVFPERMLNRQFPNLVRNAAGFE